MHKTPDTLHPPARIVIASRQSPLAMWQARHVQAELQRLYPALTVSLLGMTTEGDRNLGASLAKIGGKGLFIKELEDALADGRADIAVHSMKDVPMHLPPGFVLAATLERADPRDAFVANEYANLAALPPGTRVGTSSLRRECQLRAGFPQLRIEPLRGNVQTRLRKLDEGQYGAIILAAAGLKRLGLSGRDHGGRGRDTLASPNTKPAPRSRARYSSADFCTSIGWRNSIRIHSEWMKSRQDSANSRAPPGLRTRKNSRAAAC